MWNGTDGNLFFLFFPLCKARGVFPLFLYFLIGKELWACPPETRT